MIGKLYICPTPIGNLEDITLRSLRVLKEVDLIAAEDTRHSIKLLNHYDIKTPMTSYHEHNKAQKGDYLLARLLEGEDLALITDAGMPGISDPGEDLIKLAIENQIEVVGLPGATASITALVVSGLPTEKFAFQGFLPVKQGARLRELEKLEAEERTLILYEAPHRIVNILEDIKAIMGDRQIALARELTKLHEEVFRGRISQALASLGDKKPRGEFVIVIAGKEILQEEVDIKEEIIRYMEKGLSKKDAVKEVAENHNLPRNQVYKESLEIDRR